MIATAQLTSGALQVALEWESGDAKTAGRARSGQSRFGVWAPVGTPFGTLHPDLVALSIFLVARPWVGQRLELRGLSGVSDALASAVSAGYGIDLTAGRSVERRVEPSSGRQALAFSGGVDSTAAMTLLPEDAALIFMNRVGPERTVSETHYQTEAATHALQRLSAAGRHAFAVDTDLEYTRRPTGFPTHDANAIPALLLSDALDLRSISWGTILEAAYRVATPAGFTDWAERTAAQKVWALFSAVGLPMSPVVIGLSEVCTSNLVLQSPFASITQSCIRGGLTPCQECKKCFRKLLLDRALSSDQWQAGPLDRYYQAESVRKELSETPLHHENVYGFILSNYSGTDPVLTSMKALLRVSEIDYTLFANYYSPYLDNLPSGDRDPVEANLTKHVAPMTSAQITQLEHWAPLGTSSYPKNTHEPLVRQLSQRDSPPEDCDGSEGESGRVRDRLRNLLAALRR